MKEKNIIKLCLGTAMLALVGPACSVPNDSSIRIVNAHRLTAGPASGSGGCSAETFVSGGGSLDLSGSLDYLIQFDMENNLQVINTTVPPDTVAGPQRNDWVANRIVFTYSSLPSMTLQPEQIDFHFVLKAGATTGGFIRLDLIGPQALQALLQRVTPGNLVELFVTVQVFGELASGEKIATNKVTYPIDVYNSGFTGCRTAGDVRAPTGPCGFPGGQDGTRVICCKDVTPTPQGCPQ